MVSWETFDRRPFAILSKISRRYFQYFLGLLRVTYVLRIRYTTAAHLSGIVHNRFFDSFGKAINIDISKTSLLELKDEMKRNKCNSVKKSASRLWQLQSGFLNTR